METVKFTAEYEGVSYTFNPEVQAMKDTGIEKLTPENRKALTKKILEYQKTGQQRAETGARLRYIRDKAEGLTPDEVTALWDSVWTDR